MAITYDDIGNPLSYNNGSAYTFTWDGRELASVIKGGVTTYYTYGADGLRTEKQYGSTTYNYYYVDGQLVRMTWINSYMDFLYDESGSIYSIVHNGEQYYLVKNLQGDVVQLRSIWGTLLAEYDYDAWGNCTVVYQHPSYGDLANLNPIRYRGYFYDFETGFYYLNSRYYDSQVRRFISIDAYVSTGQNFIGYNMYAYCLNNPVMRIDIVGYASVTHMDANDNDNNEEGITAMGGGGGAGQIKVTVTQYNTSGVGQKHHPISNRIANAASQNINLRGIITRTIGTIKAFSLKDHQGYQDWHRSFDNDIVNWIYTHPTATLNDFLDYLNGIYASDAATSRFGPVAFSEYKYFK